LVHCDFTCLMKTANFIWVVSNEPYFILCLLVCKKPGEASKCCIWYNHRGGAQFPQETKFCSEVFQIICLTNQESILCLHPRGSLFLSLGHNCLWYIPLKFWKILLLLLFWGLKSGPTNCYSGNLPYNLFCQLILIPREHVCVHGEIFCCHDMKQAWDSVTFSGWILRTLLHIVPWSGHCTQLNNMSLMFLVMKLRNLVVGKSCHCCCNLAHYYWMIQYAIMSLTLYWAIIQVILCAKQALYDWAILSTVCTYILKTWFPCEV
jgi:hypothetical protein